MLAYLNSLPFDVPRTENSHLSAALPQHYADQLGWPEMVAVVGQAWRSLSPEERPGCGVFAQNYGQAGAVDFFGRRYCRGAKFGSLAQLWPRLKFWG